jgi:DNA-binding GntR family transcriptional regulator
MTTGRKTASVGERTYERVRADIIFGRLAPGRRLRLDGLARDCGVSVGTLREILNRLTSEGFVVAEGQKGFRVAPVSVADMKEIAALRLLLECDAIAKSFAAGDVDWESRVVAAHHKLARFEERMARGERDAGESWKRFDWQFHQALISACGSKALIAAHAAAFDKYLRYQMTALSYRGKIAEDEHRAMLACALSRDAAGACETLRRHVEGGMAHALATGTIR